MESGQKIMENYQPVRNSLGYQNLRLALLKVFEIDLDTETISEAEFENFGYILTYKNSVIKLIISSTEKHIQFQYGEGGCLDIVLPDPKYPETSFLTHTSLYYLVSNREDVSFLKFIPGKNTFEVERAIKILKEYLDKKVNI